MHLIEWVACGVFWMYLIGSAVYVIQRWRNSW